MKKQELHQLLKSLEKNDWFKPVNKEAKLSGGKSMKKGLRRSKRIKKKGSRKLRKLSGGKKKTYWQHSKKVLKPALQYSKTHVYETRSLESRPGRRRKRVSNDKKGVRKPPGRARYNRNL